MTMHQKVESLTKSERESLKKSKKIIMTWALANFPRPPLLLVPTENLLDHGSG
jgi:hypothetical protein